MDYQPQKSQSKALKWTIIISIVIVLNLFFNYGLSLIFTQPDYNSFCPETQVNNPPETQNSCIAVGGQWNVTVSPQGTIKTTPASVGYCNTTYSCQKKYDSANSLYSRNIFLILIGLGILSIVAGLLLRTSDVVSIGLSLGGVLSLIIASIRYWSEAGNILKVVILGVALVILIWLGIKKFKE